MEQRRLIFAPVFAVAAAAASLVSSPLRPARRRATAMLSWLPARRSRLAVLSVLALAAGVLGMSSASPALANVCSPFPSCIGAAPYQVSGTPDNSLSEWTNSPAMGGSIVRSVPNGTTSWVVCQANDGPQEDGKYNATNVPSTTWDFTWDPGISRYAWVYDWWMNTPSQKAAYSWYSWPDSAHHCNFGAPPPQAPPAVTSITAVATSPGTIHVQWQDNSGGAANYVISNGIFSPPDLAPGVYSYDWAVAPFGNTYSCFTVAAKANGLQSAWSPYACTTTPKTPWCPTADPTVPACGGTIAVAPSGADGAYQQSCDHIIAPQYTTPCPVNDWNTTAPTGADFNNYDFAETIVTGMTARGYGDAADALANYLGNHGDDWTFDSTAAYNAGSGFKAAVDNTVKCWINTVQNTGRTFDSGYLDFPAVGVSTGTWNSADWQLAVGHGFYRVFGTRQANGTWSVHLQLTSYYQFRTGENFTIWGPVAVVGADFRHFEKAGLAQDFRSIGNGTLTYPAGGPPGTCNW